MASVTPIRTAKTLEVREDLLIDIEIAQLDAVIAHQLADHEFCFWNKWKARKEAKIKEAKAHQMLEDYNRVYRNHLVKD